MKFCAFVAQWSPVNGEWIGGAWVTEDVQDYSASRHVMVQNLSWYAHLGYTLITNDAERHVVDLLWRAGQEVTQHFYEGVFNRAVWRRARKQSVEIWDCRNLSANLPLDHIGNGIDLPLFLEPYALSDQDDSRQRRWQCSRHGEWECVPCWAIRHAEIVHHFASTLNDAMQSWNLRMKRTLGGNAVALWQYFDQGKSQHLRGPLIVEMARAAYHGGRCEVFVVGDFLDIYTGDIRSHYAAIMRDAPMPDLNGLTYVEKPIAMALDELHGVIEATVNVPMMHVPPLPAVAADGQLYFPVGRVSDCWVIAELREALTRGVELIEVHRIAYTRRAVYPFQNFTQLCIETRRQWEVNHNPLVFWAKMLPNGLYGRLGVRERQTYRTYHRSYRPLNEKDIDGKDIIWLDNMRLMIGEFEIRMKSQLQNVLWAATITAYGRIKLFRHLVDAEAGLIYCDTDSIFSTVPLALGNQDAGTLRDTGHYQRGTIVGPKLYRLEAGDTPDMVAARGIPKQLALQFLNAGKVEFSQPYSLAVAVDQQRAPGRWTHAVLTNRQQPLRRQLVMPAIPGPNGPHWETRPIVFGPELPEPLDSRTRPTTSR